MKFKELKIGEIFSWVNHPTHKTKYWVKISSRCYKPHTDPFSDDIEERKEHLFWSHRKNQIGSINEEVIPFSKKKNIR